MAPKTASSSSSAGPSNGARRVKGKRTRTGCLTCRARKVKCDEQPGTCANCERVCLACRWPVVRDVLDERAPRTHSTPGLDTSPRLAPSSGPIRHNKQASCHGCRHARARCSQDHPACARCLDQGITCDYSHHSGPTSSFGSPNDDDWRNPAKYVHGIPRQAVDRYVEAYFAHVYPVQGNAIVHRGTLLRDIADGSVSRKILFAICAVASRFVETPSTPGMPPMPNPIGGNADAQRWAAEAKSALLTDDMSQENITAALILAKHDINSGRFAQAFVLGAVATRMAVGLTLYKELDGNDPATPLERETRRRLMYSCYSIDRLMSTGVPENMCVPVRSIQLHLPCNEQQYSYGMISDTPFPSLEDEIHEEPPAHIYKNVGMFGHHVMLLGIRAMIMEVARNRSPSDKLPWDPTSPFIAAERKIEAWYAALGPQFQLEPETIYSCQYQNELTPLTMLHVWYHMNVVELTRIAMPGFVESLPGSIVGQAPPGWMQQMRDVCVSHARMAARTLRHVASLVNMDSLVFSDPALPICVYESARVRLQYAFLLPHDLQQAELEELVLDVAVMASFLERMGQYYKIAKILLKEMRKMLRRHGLDPAESGAMSEPSQPGSPDAQDPWSRRVRTLRATAPRRPQPAAVSQTYPPPQVIPVDMQNHNRGSLPTQPIGCQQQTQSMPVFSEPQQISGSWDGPKQEDLTTLLGEVGQQGGGGGQGNIFDMFANWVATGYEGGLNGVV